MKKFLLDLISRHTFAGISTTIYYNFSEAFFPASGSGNLWIFCLPGKYFQAHFVTPFQESNDLSILERSFYYQNPNSQ